MRISDWSSDVCSSDLLFFHMSITAIEAFLGFLIGGTIGMIVGVVLGRAKFLADLLDPFIMAFYSLPKVALAPLFILWIGIGMDMKIVLTAAIVFFLRSEEHTSELQSLMRISYDVFCLKKKIRQ